MTEAEELSQSPWTAETAQKWLAQGQWQILELPTVLGDIRENYDGLLMHEMGTANIAVFPLSKSGWWTLWFDRSARLFAQDTPDN